MLSDDIKVIDFLHSRDFFPDDNGAWQRIKAFVEAQNTAHNTTNNAIASMIKARDEWIKSNPDEPSVFFARFMDSVNAVIAQQH